MARTNNTKSPEVVEYIITVRKNPNYCGIDAGGVQFAYGQARITPGRMADWFAEHNDVYEVEPVFAPGAETDAESKEG